MKLAPRPSRGRQRRVRVVLEIGVDLGLRDLPADLVGRVRQQARDARSRVLIAW